MKIILLQLCASIILEASLLSVVQSAQEAPQQQKPEANRQQTQNQTDRSTQSVDRLNAGERSRIAKETDEKDRLKAYLKIADERLNNARQSTKVGDYAKAAGEIQAYTQAITEAADAIRGSQNKKKRESLHKMMEMRLFRHIPYLEGLEREFPFNQAEPIATALSRARSLRIDSLNAVFGDANILKKPEELKKDQEMKKQEESKSNDKTRVPPDRNN